MTTAYAPPVFGEIAISVFPLAQLPKTPAQTLMTEGCPDPPDPSGDSTIVSPIEYTKPYGKPVNVALLQGNVPANIKWTDNSNLHIYQNLIEKRGLKITDLAARVGKNRSTIANLIRLLGLPKQVQDWLKEGKITEGQSRPLLSLTDSKKQVDVAAKVIAENWTAREVENYVSNLLNPDKKIKSFMRTLVE